MQTTLALRPFTILVGPNGAGKTSVLEALYALSRLDTVPADALFTGPLALRAVARRQPDTMELAFKVTGINSEGELALKLTIHRTRNGAPPLPDLWSGDIELMATSDNGPIFMVPSLSLRDQSTGDYWPELHRCVFLRVDPRSVCAPSLAFADATIATDGGMLPTVLANLKLSDDVAFERLLTDLRRLVPEVRGLRPLPTMIGSPNDRRAGYELVFDTDSGTGIRGTDMSEGTLVLLALLTVIHSPARPRLLLLDGLETALHPTAQMKLTKLLRKLVETDPMLQIIATTHSPFVIDCVPPESVLVFAKAADGTSGVRSLAEHPEAKRFHGQLASGQLWTLDDEETWVFGGAK